MAGWMRFFVVFAISAVLTSGCLTTVSPGPTPSPTPTIAIPLTIQINATPSRYNPAMSSTIGIRLTPVNTSGILPPGALFSWETTFGTFYRWGPPDFKVIELGAPYTGDQGPVYWSYFSELGEKYRRPVNITLSVWSPSDRVILAKSTLRIGWEDPLGFTAIVEGQG
jgi:hypothetical protein